MNPVFFSMYENPTSLLLPSVLCFLFLPFWLLCVLYSLRHLLGRSTQVFLKSRWPRYFILCLSWVSSEPFGCHISHLKKPLKEMELHLQIDTVQWLSCFHVVMPQFSHSVGTCACSLAVFFSLTVVGSICSFGFPVSVPLLPLILEITCNRLLGHSD